MGLNSLTFGNVNSTDYGVYILSDSVFNAPQRVYNMIDIPGRNGQLAIDEGRYENISVTYPAYVEGDNFTDFSNKVAEVRNAFMAQTGYQRLSDTYHPNEYRLGIYHDDFDIDVKKYLRTGEFDLTFDCKPQRFLTSGETAIVFTADGSITNPTQFEANPMLKVTGYGTLGVGDRSVIITGTAGQVIYIDCEIMEAWSMSGSAIIPRNDYVQYVGNKFPVLASGVNGISMSGNITRVEVTPRWWRL